MAEVVDPLKGTVAWFNRGYGFITPVNGCDKIFVHYTSINTVGFRSLSAGEVVEFNVAVGDNGRKWAINVSKLASNKPFLPAITLPSDVAMQDNQNLSDELLDSMNSEEEEEKEAENKEGEEERIKEVQNGEYRNWAELPLDILLLVFKKIALFEILALVQYVCKPWQKLSNEPQFWRCINIAEDDFKYGNADFMIMAAVNMSKGCLDEFSINSYMSDELIVNISDRAPILRFLRLVSQDNMSDEALVDAVTGFPLLEELEISFCSFSSKIVKFVGLACPQLKSFKFNGDQEEFYEYKFDSDESDSGQHDDIVAFSIAKHMQQLTHLQLIENTLTNAGLLAILDNCPNIQYLDIRRCFNANMDEHLIKKCALLKNVRFPNDSTADFEFKEPFNEYEEQDNYIGSQDLYFDSPPSYIGNRSYNVCDYDDGLYDSDFW